MQIVQQQQQQVVTQYDPTIYQPKNCFQNFDAGQRCVVEGQCHEHKNSWSAVPISEQEERTRKHILQFAKCRQGLQTQQQAQQLQQQQSRVIEQKPKLQDRWMTEQRHQYVYYVHKCHLRDNCMASCEQGCLCGSAPRQQQMRYMQGWPVSESNTPYVQYQQQYAGEYIPVQESQMQAYPYAQSDGPAEQQQQQQIEQPAQQSKPEQQTKRSAITAQAPQLSTRESKSREADQSYQAFASAQRQKGKQPPFHAYGHAAQSPVKHDRDHNPGSHYLRTFNAQVLTPENTQYPYITARRHRTHKYDGWRQFIDVRPESALEQQRAQLAKQTRRPSSAGVVRSTDSNNTTAAPVATAQGQVPVQSVAIQEQRQIPQQLVIPQPAQPQAKLIPNQQPAGIAQQQQQQLVQGNVWYPAGPGIPGAVLAGQVMNSNGQVAGGQETFVNFSPCTHEENALRNYRKLPIAYTAYIPPAGKQTVRGYSASECFRMYD